MSDVKEIDWRDQNVKCRELTGIPFDYPLSKIDDRLRDVNFVFLNKCLVYLII